MRPTPVILLCLVVVSGGCMGTLQPEQMPTAAPTATSTAEPTPTLTPTATATPTATPRPPQNPWRASPIVVSVADDAGTDRDYEALVEEATQYWEQNWTQFTVTERHITYLVVENASDPDIEVRFVRSIPECGDGGGDHTLGCAPQIEPGDEVEKPTLIQIKSGYDDATTLRTLKHEFGHVLGVEHGEGPDFMNASFLATTLPQTNASERSYPWQETELSVYVRYDDLPGHDHDDAKTQIRHALDYYEAGAEGHLEEMPTFSFTDDEAAADIRIYFQDQLPSGERQASVAHRYGIDPDDDGALEYYTQVEIYLSDIDVEAVGWHTGYWLAYAFNTDADGQLPPPFVDADYDTTHGQWWE